MIDVHVLHLPDENLEWTALCNQSLIGHPINIFHCDGIMGDLRTARRNGFKQGQSPYVSFVDQDDLVTPGAFQICLDALEADPAICGVYTLSDTLDEQGRSLGLIHPYRPWSMKTMAANNILEIHQLVVMRREDLAQAYLTHKDKIPVNHYHEAYVYAMMMKLKPWKALDYIGYRWRIHAAGAHHNVNLLESKVHGDIIKEIYAAYR